MSLASILMKARMPDAKWLFGVGLAAGAVVVLQEKKWLGLQGLESTGFGWIPGVILVVSGFLWLVKIASLATRRYDDRKQQRTRRRVIKDRLSRLSPDENQIIDDLFSKGTQTAFLNSTHASALALVDKGLIRRAENPPLRQHQDWAMFSWPFTIPDDVWHVLQELRGHRVQVDPPENRSASASLMSLPPMSRH